MSAERRTEPAPAGPWLSIVGIGEDGIAGLGDEAKRLISSAATVFGGRRHVELASGLTKGDAHVWPSPFDAAIDAVLALRGQPVCVLASGDPMFFGVGATLSRKIDADEMCVLPAPSAFSLAAARLGWALQDIACLSLHGRPLSLLRPHLQPRKRLLCLTSDGDGPGQIAALMTELGFGPSHITVLEALGGARATVRATTAAGFSLQNIDALNLVAIDVIAGENARVLPLSPGLPDEWFEHDGQITRRLVRAATLAALAPRHGDLLWDIGAGSGSICIEWMLRDPSLRAIAVEANAGRAVRIRRNADALGVPGLEIVGGTAPAALSTLPAPDAIFIGGGGSDPAVIDAAIEALKPGGRLVANAVTLETEAALIGRREVHGGELTRLLAEHAAPIGSMTGWRPAMPVTQWTWVKP